MSCDGRRAEGGLGPSRDRDGARPGRVRALHGDDEARPAGARLARPRPLRALGRPRLHAPVRGAAPDGLRPHDGRPQGVPPVGLEDARASRVAAHPRRQRHDGPARPGRRQRRRHGDRRAHARRALQPARPRDHRPPHVRDLLRRRHDGGRLRRGLLDRRLPRPRQALPDLRRQQDHDRGLDRPRVHGGRPARYEAYGWHVQHLDDDFTLDSIRAALAAADAETERPSFIRSARTSPTARRTRSTPPRPTARRSATRRDPAHEAGLRLGSGQDVLRAGRGLRRHGRARSRRAAAPRLGGEPLDLPRVAPGPRRAPRARARGQAARGLGVRAAGPLRRRLAGDARELAGLHQRARGHDPRARRRRGRPRPLDEHADQGRRARSRTTRSRAGTSTSASASTRWARS